MEWTVQDQYASTKIVETEALLELKQWIKDHHCQCKVYIKHCNPDFWLTPEERKTIIGCVGVCGPCGPRGVIGPCGATDSDLRAAVEPKRVLVTIQFVLSNIQAEKIVLKKLSTTVNHIGDSWPTWHASKSTESAPYRCGVYKRPGFDRAFEALKVLKSQLTELNFAKVTDDCCGREDWDSDIVERRLFDGMHDCLQTIIAYDTIDTGRSQVQLSLLAVDIAPNLEYLKHILVPAQK
jgi:hypothetical protein